MKNKNIFTKIFIKNIPLFFIEILSAYIATKVLVWEIQKYRRR